MSVKVKMDAIEICRRNAGLAKETAVKDKTAWKQEGIDLVTRHPWIKEKKAELTEIFGPLARVTIREGGKVWKWKQ